MINKNLDDITYHDIENLLHKKIDESDSLDYKKEIVDDSQLVKHVCAFANTKGGDIVFGIQAHEKGGSPTKIVGIDPGQLDRERIEQIILSNIFPRLAIKIGIIENKESDRPIMIVRVPNSYLKPHQNAKNNKYYKRFQFESVEMNEQEICDSYKNRFSSHDNVKQYTEAVTSRQAFPPDGVGFEIVMIPSNIDYRIIDTSNYENLEWMKHVETKHGRFPNIFPHFDFCGEGIMCHGSKDDSIAVHRNGCILSRTYYRKYEKNYFPEKPLATALMQIMQFGSEVLHHYGYFGEVRISVCVSSNSDVSLCEQYGFSEKSLPKMDCIVDREHPIQYIADNYEKISSSIMNDMLNHFGEERCNLFNKDGTFKSH